MNGAKKKKESATAPVTDSFLHFQPKKNLDQA